MKKMLSQLMGGAGMPGAEGAEGGGEGLPPGLAALMGGMGGAGSGGASQAQPRPGTTYDHVWKIVHAIVAFALGLYVLATSTAFAGPMVRIPENSSATEGEWARGGGINLFWAFATVELTLQSTRYFLERGKTGSGMGGWMGMVSGLLGEPWGSYVRLVARYSGIWTTVVEDGCVLIFVVGAFSWWKGAIG